MSKKVNTKLAIGMIIISIILMISTIVSASSVGLSLSSSSKLKEGDTVVVNFNLGTIDAGNGIDTITAQLSYDTNVFEQLAETDFQSSTSWKTTFAPSTKMLTLVKASKVKTAEVVVSVTLKVKSTINVDSTKIALSEILASGGKISDGGTGDITVNNTSITISKDKAAESSTDTTTSKTNTTNTTIKDNTVAKKKTLPKTGIGEFGIIAIVILAIVGIFSYVLYKKTVIK